MQPVGSPAHRASRLAGRRKANPRRHPIGHKRFLFWVHARGPERGGEPSSFRFWAGIDTQWGVGSNRSKAFCKLTGPSSGRRTMENQVEYETLLLLHGVKSTFVSARLEKSTIATECGHLGLVKAADRTHITPSLLPPSSQLSDSSWPRILKLHRYLATSAQPQGLDACASFCCRQVVRAPAETQRRVFLSCASLARESLQSADFIRGNEEHAFSCTSVPDRACRLRALHRSALRVGGSWWAPEAGICLLPRLINCPFMQYDLWAAVVIICCRWISLH